MTGATKATAPDIRALITSDDTDCVTPQDRYERALLRADGGVQTADRHVTAFAQAVAAAEDARTAALAAIDSKIEANATALAAAQAAQADAVALRDAVTAAGPAAFEEAS